MPEAPRRRSSRGRAERAAPSRARDDRGLALLMTAGGMVALLVVAALVVDMGYAKQMRREAQASSDAASLAAAQVLAGGGGYVQAAQAARDIADSNYPGLTEAAWKACTDPDRPSGYEVVGTTTGITGECVTFDATHNLVRVVLPGVDSPSFFGRVVGRDGYEVGAQAAAVWEPGGSGTAGCGICGIDGAEFAQDSSGHVDIENGRQVQADKLRITGQANSNKPKELAYYLENNSENTKYSYEELSAPVPNPFSGVEIDHSAVKVSAVMNPTCADLKPGEMYPQKLTINGNCKLPSSGIYYFRNGITISGSLTVDKGVKATLFFGCAAGMQKGDAVVPCNGSHPGNLDVSGSLQLDDPYFNGISVMFDTTGRGESVVNYNGNIKLGGAHYSKASTPMFNNGTFEATTVVFGGAGQRSYNNKGNIKIFGAGAANPAAGGGDVGLWR
jgi:hypothetical protein